MKYLVLVLLPFLGYSQKYEVRAYLGNTNISGYSQFAPQIGVSLAFKTLENLYVGGSIKNEWFKNPPIYSSYTSFGAVASYKVKSFYFGASYDYMKNYTTRDEYADLNRQDLHRIAAHIGYELKGKVAPFIEVGPSEISGDLGIQSKIGIRF